MSNSTKACRPSGRHPGRHALRSSFFAWALTAAAAAASGTASAADYASTVLLSGLNSPRGLAFGPDGALWVAEAGLAATSGPSTTVRGERLIYNETGSVTRFFGGVQSRVFSGLPSLYNSSAQQAESGPHDIVFSASGAVSVLIGAGVDPTLRNTALAPGGQQLGRLVSLGGAVDVSGFEATANPGGGPLDSNPWNVARVPGATLVTDAGSNALLRIADGGGVSLVTTFASRDLGGQRPTESVPTGLAVGPDGAYYVGELTGFPFVTGSARVHRVLADGAQSVFASGFSMIIDIAFGSDSSLYVLEYDSNGALAPGNSGALWRVATDGTRSLVWQDGLVAPTGLAIGADGDLYVSNLGTSLGQGQVLRISPVPEGGTLVLMLSGLGTVLVVARRRRGVTVKQA